MLHLILGRAGSGKTAWVHSLFESMIKEGQTDLTLIVPEQYSFFTERAMLERLGAADALKIDVTSFSRLAESVLKATGRMTGQHIDDSGRAVLMSLALDSVAEKLEIYAGHRQSPAVVTEMLALSAEFKQASVNPGEILTVSNSMADCLLKKKTKDISLVLNAYDALVRRSYFDDTDALTVLADILGERELYQDKIVAIDAFGGFTGQELKVIERLLTRAKAVYLTLCADGLYPAEDDTGVFAHTKRTARKVIDAAKRGNVPVAKPLLLSNAGKGDIDEALRALEAGLYNPEAKSYEKHTEAVTLAAASDIVGECGFVAAAIKRLLRKENYRCRDIAVIARTAETYESPLKTALKKCGVPVFIDKRQPVAAQPLIILVRSALEIAAKGFTLDAVMRCLKTGLAGFSVGEISVMENYALLWNINGKRWLDDWKDHPEGYGSALDKKAEDSLNLINALRAKAVRPLKDLKESLENTDGEEAARAVFEFLIKIGAGENLKTLAVGLEESDEPVLALEQERLWDDLCSMLDTFARSLKDVRLTPARFAALFDLVVSTRTLGSIPQGLDEITIGSADRIRTASPKAVFIVGVNEGLFPRSPVSTGILNDAERQKLIGLGLPVSEPGEYKIAEERFVAYAAFCGASQRLVLSYARKDLSGAQLSPSEIVSQIKRLFPNCAMADTADIPPLDLVEGVMPAFETMASLWAEKDELYASLRQYFENSEEYKDKLAALDRAVDKKPFEIRDKTAAGRLFGKTMYMSASRAEDYAKCPFAYYCKHGLRALARKPAELDPLQKGIIAHRVLEHLLRAYPGKQLSDLPREKRLEEIKAVITEYLDEKMGGMNEKPKRFEYLFKRLAVVLDEVAERLAAEFQRSEFIPVAFELSIGDNKDIPCYEIDLENGSKMRIRGAVDRVDTYETDGKTYLRVVDYKSSGKAFRLSDVLGGINMQMLIYLFAIWQNGGQRFGEILPAGVLYVPANAPTASLDRNATPEAIQKEKIKRSRMNGILLGESDSILGMEKGGEGIFIPVSVSNGVCRGDVISLEQMKKLKACVDNILKETGRALLNGEIAACPVNQSGKTVCGYCDYGMVCGFESGMETRRIIDLKHGEALEALDGKGADGSENAMDS